MQSHKIIPVAHTPKPSSITVDLMKYYDKDGVDISGFGVGYRHRF
jgi:hypothetical protein